MTYRMRLVVAVALVGGLLTALSAIGSPTGFAAGVGAAPFKIAVADGGLKYSPKTAHVTKGRKVKWTNAGSMSHTVTFYKRPKGAKVKSFTLSVGESKKRKIKKAGVYKFRCTIPTHSTLSKGKCSGMCGKIRAH